MDSSAAGGEGGQSEQPLQLESGKRVALIVGVTGIVGGSLAELLTEQKPPQWKVYGVSRHPLPAWLQRLPIHHIQCDLLDRHESVTALSPLADVTHVFFVTWTARPTEEENCIANTNMLQNTLDPILSNCQHLKHVCLQTGIKHYMCLQTGIKHNMGSHSSYSKNIAPIYMEFAPRLPEPNFYYAQEDLLFESLSSKRPPSFQHPVSWSIHRPGLIFGLSPISFMNSAIALGVYASICKHEGTPLVFTGTQSTWDACFDISDALLIAKQEIWASTHAHAHNQAFNVSNGDDVTWKDLWHVVADHFGIKALPFLGHPKNLIELMEGKAHVWEEIVKQYGLFPTKLSDFFGGWQVLDVIFRKLPAGKSSMEKSKEFGFHNSKDTKESLKYWFERMRKEKFIP